MATIPVKADGFLRQVAGGSTVGGGIGARSDRKSAGGIAGKRQSVDEYVASLPAQAAFIGGKTLETLKSLPPVPQQKGQGAKGAAAGIGIGIGINNNNGIGINSANGIGAGLNKLGGAGIGINNNGAGTNNTSGIGAGLNKLGGAGIGINNNGAGTNSANGIGAGANTLGNGTNKTGGLGGTNAVGIANHPNTSDEPVNNKDVDDADKADETDKAEDENAAGTDKTGAELTPDEQSVVNELRNRDREVRAHEQAHISAGGAYIRGGASYQYQRGPDNKSYAVGGEVGIDTAPERDDHGATITKMQAVRAAALAPADPSAQDRAVAAAAAQNENIARANLAEEERNTDV